MNRTFLLIAISVSLPACAQQLAGDLARAGAVPGCADVLEGEGWSRAAARDKCEFIGGPATFPEDIEAIEKEADRAVDRRVREETTPSLGRVLKRSSMGRSYYVLEGMRVPTQAKGNALALDIDVLAAGGEEILFQQRVAFRRTSGWCYLECHTFGVFGTTQLPGGYAGEDGKNWKTYKADHRGSTTAHSQSETVSVPMTLSELHALASGQEFGFQLCNDRITFTPEQKARLVKYVEVVRDAVDPAGASRSDGGDEVGIPACDEYLAKYRRCIMEKAPASSRDALIDAMEGTRDAWREAAAGPAREQLPEACAEALHAVKTVAEPWGCEW